MNQRVRSLAVLAAGALVAAGCANWRLTPFPDKSEFKSGEQMSFPSPMPDNVESGKSDILPSPFPKRARMDRSRVGFWSRYGLSPMPHGSKHEAAPAEDASVPDEVTTEEVTGEEVTGKSTETVRVEVTPPPPPPPPPPPAKPTLALKFEPGSSVKLLTKMDNVTKFPSMGEAMDTTVTMEMRMEQKVTAVDDNGRGTVQNTIESLAFTMQNMMMGEVGFDTSKPETIEAFGQSMVAQMMPQIMNVTEIPGTSFFVTLNKNGTVHEAGEIANADAMGPLGSGMNPSQMSGTPAAFPDEPLREGLTWDVDVTSDSGQPNMKTRMTGTMTVTSWNEETGIAVVSSDLKIALAEGGSESEAASGEKPAAAANPMEDAMNSIKMKSGEVVGEDTYDINRGLRIASVNTTKMVMEMKNPMMGEGLVEMLSDIKITQTLRDE